MPVNVGTLLTNLAKKAGYDPTLLAFPQDSFEVPDELVEALNGRLLTEESARNNPKLKGYFTSQVLDVMDTNIKSLLDEFEVDEEGRGEILGIKSTYDRIPALAKKIRELEASKSAAGKSDKAALQEQINKKNQEMAQLLAEQEKKIKDIQANAQNEITNFMFRNAVGSADLVTDQFDRETMLELAEQRIRKELQAQGARAINKNGMLTLVQASDEGLDFYQDNKQVNFNDFIEKVLANAKILKVTKTTAGQSGIPANNGANSQTTTPATNPAMNPILAKIEQAKAAYANTGS